jgi:hypothetical protein
LKQSQRHATYRGEWHDRAVSQLEMLVPLIAARMEQTLHFTAFRIDGGEVASFVLVTEGATQCQIAGGGSATMLRGNYVIDFMWDERQFFRYQAILACSAGPGAHLRAQSRTALRHYWEA